MNRIFCPVVLLSLLACGFAESGDRVALVIGVDKYDHLAAEAQLVSAVADARKIATTLEDLDPAFEVTLLTDVEQDDAEEAIFEFKKAARGAECALIYFAGHGIEYHGENFLIVRDTAIEVASENVSTMKRRLGNAAISLQAMVDELDATGAAVKVVILDACRDNPLRVLDTGGTRSVLGGSSGLAVVTPPSGTLIAYSADAGQQANDGLFTQELVKHIKTPGLPLPHVFALTREAVKTESTKLMNQNRGVFHEPAEYTKLNLSGMKFSFSGYSISEVEDLRKQLESMKKLVEQMGPSGGGGVQASQGNRYNPSSKARSLESVALKNLNEMRASLEGESLDFLDKAIAGESLSADALLGKWTVLDQVDEVDVVISRAADGFGEYHVRANLPGEAASNEEKIRVHWMVKGRLILDTNLAEEYEGKIDATAIIFVEEFQENEFSFRIPSGDSFLEWRVVTAKRIMD